MKKLLLIILCLGLVGCTTIPSVKIYSETDLSYNLSKVDPIYVVLKNSDEKIVTIPERNFFYLLKSLMIENGFNVVEKATDSKYFLNFFEGSKTFESSYTSFVPTTSTTRGSIGNTPYSSTTTSSAPISSTSSYSMTGLALTLFSTEEWAAKKKFVVWQGTAVEYEYTYEKYKKEIIQALLDYFGTNCDIRIPIKLPEDPKQTKDNK
ncbi:MAG: hypothetical protein PHY73_02085 [Candidatus Omnitrophica bacterium]|nr:hypothetical protein [Candidatus Omnitrophota bacterium]